MGGFSRQEIFSLVCIAIAKFATKWIRFSDSPIEPSSDTPPPVAGFFNGQGPVTAF